MSNTELSPRGLVVIARNARGQIITPSTSRHELAGALKTACGVLKLKANAVGAEIHADEGQFRPIQGNRLPWSAPMI